MIPSKCWLLLFARYGIAKDLVYSKQDTSKHQQDLQARREVAGSRPRLSNTTTESANATGLSYAVQCVQDLTEWHSSSSIWSIAHNMTYTFMETNTQPAWTTLTLPYYDATSMTTLCDGHPRVVGAARSTTTTTMLGSSGAYLTSTYPVLSYSYNVPAYSASTSPCTIQKDDCQALYDRNTSIVQFQGSSICNYSAISSTTKPYPTDSKGSVCSACYVRARNASILYWPVRTVDGPGDLCNGTAQTIGLTRTGNGPNTFVTEGITITSPSVGIALADVSRVDGCYTTVASTIVVVHASELMSVRGARAIYDWRPFEYQDLNYKCQSSNGSYWIQDEPGDKCYQQVPAAAYFSGESAFIWDEYYPTALGPKLTIGPGYRPYVLPPASMTIWAESVYNTDCLIQVDGVWDPPYALVQGTAVATPHPAWQKPMRTSESYPSMTNSDPATVLKPGSTISNPVSAWQTGGMVTSTLSDSPEADAKSSSPLPGSFTKAHISETVSTLSALSPEQETYTMLVKSHSIAAASEGTTTSVDTVSTPTALSLEQETSTMQVESKSLAAAPEGTTTSVDTVSTPTALSPEQETSTMLVKSNSIAAALEETTTSLDTVSTPTALSPEQEASNMLVKSSSIAAAPEGTTTSVDTGSTYLADQNTSLKPHTQSTVGADTTQTVPDLDDTSTSKEGPRDCQQANETECTDGAVYTPSIRQTTSAQISSGATSSNIAGLPITQPSTESWNSTSAIRSTEVVASSRGSLAIQSPHLLGLAMPFLVFCL